MQNFINLKINEEILISLLKKFNVSMKIMVSIYITACLFRQVSFEDIQRALKELKEELFFVKNKVQIYVYFTCRHRLSETDFLK